MAETEVPRPTRGERRPRDMALSLVVLLVPVLVVVLIYRVVQGGEQPVTVDTAPVLAQARSAGAFPVSEPSGLGDDWLPISASFQQADGGRVLRIGYVTPDDAGVQLIQSDVPAERLLPAELTAQNEARGGVDVDGQAWQRYTARPGEAALVLLQPDRTLIIVGNADERELNELAAALTP
ncbi:DUF4245 domain-containing protein [Actinomycetes bacterium KLBMP 9797]